MKQPSPAQLKQIAHNWLTTKLFNVFLNDFTEMVKEIAHNTPTLQPAILTINLNDDGYELVLILIDSLLDGQKYVDMARVGFNHAQAKKRVVAAYFCSEVWVSSKPGSLPPADDPDRQEAVMISGLTVDGRSNAARIAISRNETGTMQCGQVDCFPYPSQSEIKVSRHRLLLAFWEGVRTGLAQHK